MERMYSVTRKQEDRAIARIKAGNYEETAAALAGIPRTTWLYNKRVARKLISDVEEGVRDLKVQPLTLGEERLVIFYERIRVARAASKAAHLKNIVDAGKKEWQASGWYLERTDPEHYGKRESIRVAASVLHGELAISKEEAAELKQNLLSIFPTLVGARKDEEET